ncbi:MAG TPA: carboxypeptidase-like regulatory domain-containing protein [Opitutales bacterium]|jgi:hypothetical protein|nr:carboxypeptidase-like regulatory domain-containing protein [Opitutales bacterium]
MMTRKYFLMGFGILLLGMAGWWHFETNNTRPTVKIEKNHLTQKAREDELALTAKTITITPLVARSANIAIASAKPPALRSSMFSHRGTPDDPIPLAELIAAGVSKDQIIQGVQDAANAQPINVYGKVVDQYGSPVAGAAVHGGVLLSSGGDKSRNETYETVTDSHGEFKFENLHGLRMGVKIEKPGYEYSQSPYLEWWDSYKPDPANPAVFSIYKLQGAEPMAHSKIHDYIPVDGKQIRYDLLTGKKVLDGGDLIVKLSRNPVDIKNLKTFDWQFSMQVVNGGLIEIHDLYPYLAPEKDYLPDLTVSHNASDKDWTSELNATYYIKSRNGQIYARITVRLGAHYQPPPTAFDVEIYANPNGSRNLEFDPAKQIKAP